MALVIINKKDFELVQKIRVETLNPCKNQVTQIVYTKDE